MRRLRDLPVKRKLQVIAIATIAVSLLTAGAGIVFSDVVLFRARLARELSASASLAADDTTAALASGDSRAATQIPRAFRQRPHILAACIYRPDETVFARYSRSGGANGCPPPAQGEEVRYTRQGLFASQLIVLDNHRLGTLVLTYDLDEIAERIRIFLEIVLIVLLASSLLAFFLSSGLWAGIAEPISRMAQAVAAVSQTGDYRVRVEHSSEDELGSLAHAFNKMLDRIHARDAEIQSARDSLETTLNSIGDAVLCTDRQGTVVFANPVALSLLQWPGGNPAGKPIEDVFRIVNELTHEPVEIPIRKVLREGKVTGLANHTVLISGDGTEIPIDDSAAPVKSGEGAIQGTVLVFRDITERRRAEANRQLLASVIDSSDDAIITEDLNGTITSWNEGAHRIFWYTAQEAIGQPLSMLAAPERGDEMPEMLDRIRSGERIDHYQTLRRTKSGQRIYASISMSPLQDARGRVIGASKIARDVTAEHEALAQLAEQRRRLRVTLASIGDAVISTDAAGAISYMNPVAERLTGWRTEEASGRPLDDVFRIVNEDSRQTVENPVAKVLREGDVVGLANHTVLIARDGSELAIDDSAAPIRGAQGEIMGVVLIFRDITEKRAAEKQRAELLARERALTAEKALRETEAELARLVRAQSVEQLASSIAHEINQPLAGIITNAAAGQRWLDANPPNIAEARASLAMLERDGNRAAAVIRRIRDFLKKEPAPNAPLDINEVIREAAEFARPELLKRHVGVRMALSSELPCVEGDRIQLQQVILNLIMNGAEAMDGADGLHELLIASNRGVDSAVSISVRDTGAGIKPEDVPRMFTPFFTTKPQGMGMGLSISRTIIEAHGGRIWAERNEGPGLTVRIVLPAGER